MHRLKWLGFVLVLGLVLCFLHLPDVRSTAAQPSAYPPPTAQSLYLPIMARSMPARLVELVGQIGGGTYAVAVQGSYAYIGVGPRLAVVDISDPAHPTFVGQSDVLPRIVEDIVVAGGLAYVADGDGGLRIIDVSNPAAPREVGFYDTPGYANDVAVAGSLIYVADGEGGLVILR